MEEHRAAVMTLINGRVQGVGFRYWTQCEASALGLCGYVRNLPQGGVEALFEGDSAVLDQMIQLLHEGPPGARVTSVQTERRAYSGEYSEFRVRF